MSVFLHHPQNTETCRSNFNINFMLLTCTLVGVVIITLINQNAWYKHNNKYFGFILNVINYY